MLDKDKTIIVLLGILDHSHFVPFYHYFGNLDHWQQCQNLFISDTVQSIALINKFSFLEPGGSFGIEQIERNNFKPEFY